MLRNTMYSVKFEKITHHKIGYCTNCGWVHDEIRRKRVEEVTENGKIAVIKSLCLTCLTKFKHQVICNLCGRTEGSNLYPVSVMRRQIDEENKHTCNLFLHLCDACRKIPHGEVLKRMSVPNMCDTCKDKFACYTSKHGEAIPSHIDLSKEKKFHKRSNIPKYRRVE